MYGNETGSNDRGKSPSLMRSNNDQGRRSKEVSLKVGESLKENPKRKRPKSRSLNLQTIEVMEKEVLH